MRASGLQGDAPSEIIEIFDDDTDAFGNRAPSNSSSDAGGPRWVGPVAVLALAAVIGYGVASSDSSGGSPKVVSAPSTTYVARTTLPAPTTTVPLGPPVPYYAADPPRQFKIQAADLQVTNRDYGNGNRYELWATQDGSASSSSSWFSIDSFSGSSDLSTWNAYRLQTAGGVFAIAHMPSGQSTAQFTAGSNSLQLTAFGWSDDDLVRLAESVSVRTGTPVFTDPTLIKGYYMISTVDPWAAVLGQPPEQVFYATTADPFGGFYISVSPVRTEGNGDFTLDRPTALRFLLDSETEFTVDGQSAVAGALANQRDYALATWTAGDHIVTVTGKMSVPQLVAIAGTVHEVNSAEWEGMKFQAIHNASETNSHNNTGSQQLTLVPVSFGTDAQGKPWTIRAAPATYGNAQQIEWVWSSNSVTTMPDDTLRINTFVDKDRTYVLVDLPRSIAPSAELRVSRAGLDAVVVPFNDIDPSLDRTLAAYAFSEFGPYTAQVVGADGTVLATWPPS